MKPMLLAFDGVLPAPTESPGFGYQSWGHDDYVGTPSDRLAAWSDTFRLLTPRETIIPLTEEAVWAAAQLSTCPTALQPWQAWRCLDRLAQQVALDDLMPACVWMPHEGALHQHLQTQSARRVVKLRGSMESDGVQVYRPSRRFSLRVDPWYRDWLAAVTGRAMHGYVVQDYIKGPQLEVQGYVDGGGGQHLPWHPVHQCWSRGRISTYTRVTDPTMHGRLFALWRQAAARLGVRSCVLNIEVRDGKILEAQCRLGQDTNPTYIPAWSDSPDPVGQLGRLACA